MKVVRDVEVEVAISALGESPLLTSSPRGGTGLWSPGPRLGYPTAQMVACR